MGLNFKFGSLIKFQYQLEDFEEITENNKNLISSTIMWPNYDSYFFFSSNKYM